MPFAIPSLDNLAARWRAAFQGALPGADAWSPFNNVGVTAKIGAQEMWALYGRLGWVSRQAVPYTADDRDWIKNHAAPYGIVERPAVPASGSVTVTATGPVTIAAGAAFARADGQQYAATLGGSIIAADGGAVTVAAQALSASALGNAVADTPLDILSGVSGAGASAALASVSDGGIVGGLDLETTEDLKARLLFRLAYRPQGGAAADYVDWLGDVTGVTRVFVERLWDGPGTVRVFPLFDDLRPGGIPTPGDIAACAARLDDVVPASAGLTLATAIAHPIDVTISGLIPSDASTQSAAIQAIAAAIRAMGAVAGNDASPAGLPFIATPYSFSPSWIDEAVSTVTGERRHLLVSPTADVAIAAGNIPTLGMVTFI